MFKSKELNFLNSRGYIKQLTHSDELDNLLAQDKKITFYIGFDCTAKSLHAGHLIPIMIARHLSNFGHQAIIILGTTTAKIGDPSGKNEQRKILSHKDIEENFHSISKIIKKFIKSENPDNQPLFLKNDWLEEIGLVEFLRNYGVHFSVNRMVNMETFATRLENQKPLSFLEFSYSLFQAYDFLHLYEKYNCQLQIGGSDQWGNIVAGVDLVQKIHHQSFTCGATTNLLLNASGEKMGKSIGGAIWLDENMLNPEDYWQYFRNIDDRDIVKFMNLLTDMKNEEIKEIQNKIESENNENLLNNYKILLATQITEICHGAEIAKQIEANEKLKFSKNINANDIENIKPDLEMNFSEIEGISMLEFLKKITQEFSGSQLKTLISQNAVKINRAQISDINFVINKDFLEQSNLGKNILITEIGKKKKIIVKINY